MKNKILFIFLLVLLFSCKDVYYPGIPVNLSIKKQSDGCLLKWEPAPEDIECGQDHNIFYYVYRQTNPQGEFRLLNKVKAGRTYLLDRQVKEGEVYQYFIYASWKRYLSEPSLPAIADYR